MTAYRRLALKTPVPTIAEPAAAPLTPIKRETPHGIHRALDTQLGSGRRVLGRYSLDGASQWLVPDGDDPTSGSRIYPDSTTPRVVLRLEQIELAPGSLVRLDVVAVPSGPTQKSDGGAGFELDTISGEIKATVTYWAADGVTSTTVEASIAMQPSQEPQGAVPQSVFGALFTASAIAFPGPLVDDAAEWAKWTSGVSVDIVLELIGSPRVVDAALVEHAFATTVELADAWPTSLYVTDDGQPLDQPPTDWPQTQASASDRGFGTMAIAEAIAAHGDLLGGPVIWWSSATEHANTLSEWAVHDEAPAFAVAGATPGHVSTAWTEQDELPGWTTASHAAGLVQSGDEALDRRTAVVPVWIAAYMRVSGTGTAYLEIKTSDWDSYILETSSLTWEWVRVPGWIEVGANPEDDRKVRAFAYTSTGGINSEPRYISISRRRVQ